MRTTTLEDGIGRNGGIREVQLEEIMCHWWGARTKKYKDKEAVRRMAEEGRWPALAICHGANHCGPAEGEDGRPISRGGKAVALLVDACAEGCRKCQLEL